MYKRDERGREVSTDRKQTENRVQTDAEIRSRNAKRLVEEVAHFPDPLHGFSLMTGEVFREVGGVHRDISRGFTRLCVPAVRFTYRQFI